MRTKPLALAASAILGTSLLLTGGSPALASPGTPATRTAFEAKPIIWKKCPKGLLRDLKAQCGFLVVPLDHSRPKGKKIRLAVSRIKHTAKKADYQGALLINPGGPGGAGRDEVLQSILVSEKVGAAYDWIGFDPRGVGASRPALSCDSKHTGYDRPPYVPNTAAGEKIWLERSKDYAAKCAKAGGALLDNLKTTDNVKDMEILRRALGKKKISFLGYSYGSYLGQVYATQHPNRVHRMVLDGVVDARKTWYESNLEQNHAFERNMDAFFAWIATKHSTYRLGRTAPRSRSSSTSSSQPWTRRPPAAGSAATSGPTSSCPPATPRTSGPTTPNSSPAGCTSAGGSRSRRSSTPTTRRAPARTTATPSTWAPPAPTPSGRPTGRRSRRTTAPATVAPRS